MTRRLKVLVVLLACVALVLCAQLLFERHLKRRDEKLDKDFRTLPVFDNQPSPLKVRVPFPADLLSVLQTPERFRMMYRVSDIPNPVQIAFAKAIDNPGEEGRFSMAEPGAWPWNVGDVLIAGLPCRRLKAVAASESLCLVFYEHGGFAKSDDVAAFRLLGDRALAVWHSSFAADVANPAKLLAVVRGDAFGDGMY